MAIKTFSAKVENLPEVLNWLRHELEVFGLKSSFIQKMELVAEEAIANIIFHTYKKKEGEIEIVIEVAATQMQMTIRDWGPPFDPLLFVSQVDVKAPLKERDEGGLGIHLMRQLVDQIHYRRDLESNVLTLIKSF
ncbi:MAG: ATP-binding protein [Chlamydiia bacterium]|nr:ATP-binding protein [Chlamydiia bacterium]